MGPSLGWIALLLCLAVACAWDWRQRRIPNALVLATAATGLALQTLLPAGQGLFAATSPGAVGTGPALLALVALLLPGLLLWRLRFFGAGDAKLLAAVGPFVGPAGVLPVLLFTLVCGGVLALLARALPLLALSAPRLASGALASGALRLPYALAIAAGTVTQALATTAGWALW